MATEAAEAAKQQLWQAAAGNLAGRSLRLVEGGTVTLSRANADGVVFTTGAGREMPAVPWAQLGTAIQQWEGGFDVSHPWQLRVFAKVELSSYVWALLHEPDFARELGAGAARAPSPGRTRHPVVDKSVDGDRYEIRTRHGMADPRPPVLGAEWNDELAAWELQRTDSNLRRANELLQDELPGERETARPYVLASAGVLLLFSAYSDRGTVPCVAGRAWASEQRCWQFPLRADSVQALVEAFGGRLIVPANLAAVGTPPRTDLPQAGDSTESLTARSKAGATISASRPAADADGADGVAVAAVDMSAFEWRTGDGQPAVAAWLEGQLERLDGDVRPPESTPAAAAALVSLGDFDGALRIAPHIEPGTPDEAAVLLAAVACARLLARFPAQLAEVDPRKEVVPADGFDAARHVRVALANTFKDRARGAVGLAMGIMMATEQCDSASAGAVAAMVPEDSPWFGRASYFAAVAMTSVTGLDAPLSRTSARALSTAVGVREFADLFTSVWAQGRAALGDSLLSDAFPAVIGRGGFRDLSSELFAVLDAAAELKCPALPVVANAAAEALEDGTLVDGASPANSVKLTYERAVRFGTDFHAESELARALQRLLRWHAARGEHGKLQEVARVQATRPALRVAAETAIAYSLAEQGEALAAVDGLCQAYGRLRVAAPDDAATLLLEARSLAFGQLDLEAHIAEAAPAAQLPPPVEQAWPKDAEALIVGGNEALAARGMGVLRASDITAQWLTSDSAQRGSSLRDRVRGNASVVVLLTPHIAHSIAYRATEAAGGAIPILLYDRYGAADLPRFLLEWSRGALEQYRPGGV